MGDPRVSDDDKKMPEPNTDLPRPFHGQLPDGLDRAVKLAREVLKEQGLSDDEIDRELGKLPDSRPKKSDLPT